MSETPAQQPTYIIPPPSAPNWRTPLLVGVLVLLAATNIYLFVQLNHLRADNMTLRNDMNSSIEQLKVQSSEAVQRAHRNLESVQAQLQQQKIAADRLVGQAKIDAEKRVEQLQSRVAEEQQKQAQVIAAVKQTADTASTKVADVSTDVGNVKTDLGNTKTQLESTIANLKRATGELDDHASLIATNAGELKALRELGERNYTEFNVPKQKEAVRVGDVMIKLKKTDPKKNKFTIEITADDKTVERKDRSINEPIQFLTSKARQPYEIVVNTVTKQSIVGYLSTPKVFTPRAGAPATGSGL